MKQSKTISDFLEGLTTTGLFLLLFIQTLWSCESSNRGENTSPVLATVNQDSITLRDFDRLLQQQSLHPESKEEPHPSEELRKSLLDELIERRLLLQESRRQELSITDSELQEAVEQIQADYTDQDFESLLQQKGLNLSEWKEQVREDLLIKKLLSRNIDRKIVIQEEDTRSYYQQHEADFATPERVKARQIVVAKEEEAREIRQRLLQGTPFEILARERSLSPDSQQGGDLGLFKRGEMPEEFDMVFSLKEEAISPIVKTPYGYHLFKVEKRVPSRALTYPEVQEQIRTLLFQERRENLYNQWFSDLKSSSSIKVNLSVLQH
jgi:parvulin-like peptidyl-prolyl isomerase